MLQKPFKTNDNPYEPSNQYLLSILKTWLRTEWAGRSHHWSSRDHRAAL